MGQISVWLSFIDAGNHLIDVMFPYDTAADSFG